MVTGIYCIENIINEKKYIGQAKDFDKRMYHHKRNWNKENYTDTSGENRPLWNSIKKYGEKNFKISIIEECKIDDLNYLETFYINKFNSLISENGYNILKEGFSRNGIKHSEETKRKISLITKGKKRTKETRERISNAKIGIPRPKESVEKMAASKRGKKLKPDHIEKHRQKMIGLKTKNSSSKYIGVCFDKSRNKWMANTFLDGEKGRRKRKNIGRYETEIEAAKKYNSYIIENNLSRPLNIIKGDK